MKEKEKEIQQKATELQFLEQHINTIQQHLHALNKKSQELEQLRENLTEINKIKKITPIISEISNNVFLKCEMKETNNFLVNVGANIVIEYTAEEADKLIEDQIKHINNSTEKIESQLSKLVTQMQLKQEELVNMH